MGKILTHHEIIGHIAEQIESVITYPPPPPRSPQRYYDALWTKIHIWLTPYMPIIEF